MTYQKRIGKQGEQIALRFLEEKGYQILGSNYHTRFGEIDLIAQKDGVMVFVEVKTRTNTAFGLPEESVTLEKLAKIESAVLIWLQEHPDTRDDWRLDVIAILLGNEGKIVDLQHFINVT